MGKKMMSAGQLAELTGWVRRLTSEEYQRRRGLLRRATDPKREIGPALLYPFKNERPLEWGWNIEREGAFCEAPVDISKIELVPFHKDGEEWISGGEMMRRASDEKAFPGCQNWSQHHAEDILSRADELPADWARNDGPILLFPDTVLLGGGVGRYMPYLFWFGGRWRLHWFWFDDGFNQNCRFVRLRK